MAITIGIPNTEGVDSNKNASHDKPNRASREESTANFTRVAARGTLLTLILRLFSFACTQITFRALVPEILGANLGLELLLTTVLFISREGFRLSLTQKVGIETWTVGIVRQQSEPSKTLGSFSTFLFISYNCGHR